MGWLTKYSKTPKIKKLLNPSVSLPFSIKALILDMDGVLWQGPQPIGDLPTIFTRIQQRGWKVVLATNNATRTPQQYLDRLDQLGVRVEPWQVVNSVDVTTSYLTRKYPSGGTVYVIGEVGILEALTRAGFTIGEDHAIAVVAGMDRSLNYEKLSRATLLIRSGVPFIGTNPDRTFPTPEGLVPGAGAILAALETATSITPTIMGKPSPAMYQLALERLGTSPAETLVVGDRLETDIAGAQAIGCRSALVLSGVSTEADGFAWQPQPDIIAKDLASLV
jgi:4-nitrophenyl phosphatase